MYEDITQIFNHIHSINVMSILFHLQQYWINKKKNYDLFKDVKKMW